MARFCSRVSSKSIHIIWVLGVIKEYAVWSLMWNTLSTRLCSFFSKVPSSVACSIKSFTSSSVTVSSIFRFSPSMASSRRTELASRETTGFVTKISLLSVFSQ